MTTPPLTLADSGRINPVCCAADISAEVSQKHSRCCGEGSNKITDVQVKDRLLQKAQDHGNAMTHCLVFVDSLDEKYDEESEIGENTPSKPASPFKGKTPEECALLLQQLQRNGADIAFEGFVIMDQRSLEDDTILLVEAPLPGDGELAWVRAPFELAYARLLTYAMGDSSARKDRIVAEGTPDGVFRE